jgi:regulator of sigma E protease
MDFLIKAAQLILSLSILVILHELGHFIPARLFKTRVEKFYLFFNPWFSIFKKKIGDTEWGIGWLPLGGYVKIAGMVDESMDKEQLALPPQPWEFRSKPAWQRLIIMLGGVTVNLLLGMFIYICVVFAYGEDKLNPADVQNGLAIHPYMEKYGFNSGDNISAVDGKKVENILDLNAQLMLRDAQKFTVKKQDGSTKTIQLPENIAQELFQSGAMAVFSPRSKGIEIKEIEKKSPAAKTEIKAGDKVIAVNGKKLVYSDEFQYAVFNGKGKTTTLTLNRNGKQLDVTIPIPSKGDFAGRIGISHVPTSIVDAKMAKHVTFGFGESIGRGIAKGKNTLTDYIAQFKFVFTKKGATSIGGFGSIGNLFPSSWDWQIFWLNTAFISIVLAFMNVLPIPALDGGHVVFLLYEIITGKEAPQKVLEYAQYVGFFLLMGLLLYANGNDLGRWLF